jgi:acetyl-CoA C-acetyltransferase
LQSPICSLVSAGCARYGRRDGLSAAELLDEALDELFANCPRLSREDIKGIFIGQAFEVFEHKASGAEVTNNYGFLNLPTIRVETASSSGGASLRLGILAIMSGMYDLVLCCGTEKMTSVETSDAIEIISMASNRAFEQWSGANLAALNALAAREHMRKYGTTMEQLAAVAVKNHENAFDNPKAYLHKRVTVKDVLSSKVVCSPLKLYDCSPMCDGASAVALCSPEIAGKFSDAPIDIMGSGEASDSDVVFREDLTSFRSTRLSLRNALAMSGLSINDMDLIELHDAFTINEIIAYEDLGLCEAGKGGKFAESGAARIDGEIPVNTSGGLKAKGHPIGSSGIGQVYEVYQQLSGQVSGSRRVKDAQIAMTHSMGGAGVTAFVHVFKNR